MHTDTLHEPSDHLDWNESLYFNFYDRANDVCGFMRIGLKPNRDETSMFCFLLMPDGSILGMKGAEAHRGELSAKGLSYRMVEAERLWGIGYEGALGKMGAEGPIPVPVRFDLSFECLNDVFDYRRCVSGEAERVSQRVAAEHLEQFGRVRGSLSVGDDRYEIDGLGERDHSWGVREWTAPRMWIWLTAEFDADLALNLTSLDMEVMRVDAGFVHIDGEDLAIVGADVETSYAPGGAPESLLMTLRDERGGTHEVRGEVVRLATLPFTEGDSRSIMYETLTRYELDGRIGYGIAEYLIRE